MKKEEIKQLVDMLLKGYTKEYILDNHGRIIGTLIGQVMRMTGGTADTKLLQAVLADKGLVEPGTFRRR